MLQVAFGDCYRTIPSPYCAGPRLTMPAHATPHLIQLYTALQNTFIGFAAVSCCTVLCCTIPTPLAHSTKRISLEV